jgi:YD repeat-containing protein
VYTYTYDAVGNRQAMVSPEGTLNYTYHGANRLTSVGGVTYTWDDNGNLTSDGVRSYDYDHTNGDDYIEIISDIPANGSHGYNTRYGDHAGTLADLGNDWPGTVVVTTTSPLGIAAVAHSTIKYPNYAYLTNYNGVAVE